MNCEHCEERISDYLENALDVNERRALDLHFSSCHACAELLAGVSGVMEWGRRFPVHEPPAWLAARIVANTPHVVRETWTDLLAAAWRGICEPRMAMGMLAATLFLGWFGAWTGMSANLGMIVRDPSTIYYQTETLANRAYDRAIRSYYSSPIVIQVQSEIQYRLDQLRENS